MANLMDYMAWRGEFGFDKAPWNDVDALIMANLSYLNLHGTDDERGWTLAEAKRLELVRETPVSAFEDRKAQFEAMAETVRFSGVRMHHFIAATDEEAEVQFSATCYDMPDGTLCIGFRGTDGTFVGWREDFNMSYKSPVPAQEAAVAYLEKAAALDSRPIRVTGHSKGGNLAMYAAACCRPEVQDRLTDVYSFDGPGLDPEVFSSEGYGRIAGKVRSFVPQTSIVGLLMSYPEPYTVVCSETSNAIQQHDPMNWQVYGPRFVTRDKVDDSSLMLSETLHEWLNRSKRKDRGRMVDALFDLLDKTRANNFSEIMNASFRNAMKTEMDLVQDPTNKSAADVKAFRQAVYDTMFPVGFSFCTSYRDTRLAAYKEDHADVIEWNPTTMATALGVTATWQRKYDSLMGYVNGVQKYAVGLVRFYRTA